MTFMERVAPVVEGTILALGRKSSVAPLWKSVANTAESRIVYGAGPYLELFARETKPGWDCWGNQSGLFDAGAVATHRQPAQFRQPTSCLDYAGLTPRFVSTPERLRVAVSVRRSLVDPAGGGLADGDPASPHKAQAGSLPQANFPVVTCSALFSPRFFG